MSNRPIKHGDKTLFPSESKFFKDLIPGERFKTKSVPTIYLAIDGEAAVIDNDTESKGVYFPPNFPVTTLKAF